MDIFDTITNPQLKKVARRYLGDDAWNVVWSMTEKPVRDR